jgi:hypothetical protein
VCPEGTTENGDKTGCVKMENQDTQVVYFPFLILTFVTAAISWLGRCVKPSHLVVTNFVIMLGFIEHCALVAQIALTFIYATPSQTVTLSVLWLGYLATLTGFNIAWYKRVTLKDPQYIAYCRQEENRPTLRIRFYCSANWRVHKLLYSHFFGLLVNQCHFSRP